MTDVAQVEALVLQRGDLPVAPPPTGLLDTLSVADQRPLSDLLRTLVLAGGEPLV